jgi:hypothetical protein
MDREMTEIRPVVVTEIQTESPQAEPSHRTSGWKLWMRDLLFSAAASVLIITFLYQPVRV